eukprot:765220-Hanusia_phi.AAC.1
MEDSSAECKRMEDSSAVACTLLTSLPGRRTPGSPSSSSSSSSSSLRSSAWHCVIRLLPKL